VYCVVDADAAKRPVFDLKASLARPLTWTPHRGKLKPFSVGRVDVKAVKPKTRFVHLLLCTAFAVKYKVHTDLGFFVKKSN